MSIERSARHRRRSSSKPRKFVCAVQRDCSLSIMSAFLLRAGEVLGVAGIEGNGQTQLAQALLGLLPLKSGQFLFDGRSLVGQSTSQIRKAGVGSIPDDRQGMGLVLQYSIQDNFMLNRFAEKPFAKSPFWLDQKAASRCAEELLKSF